MSDVVELRIAQVQPRSGGFPVGPIVTITTDADHVRSVAESWTREHVLAGTDSVLRGLGSLFGSGEPPAAGFLALINPASGLLFLARWPWCSKLPQQVAEMLE